MYPGPFQRYSRAANIVDIFEEAHLSDPAAKTQGVRALAKEPTSLLTITDEHYFSLARSAETVSFDVFDTLLHRKVLLPFDIFALVGKKIGIPEFAKQRFEAEARARKRARPQTVEVCLDEIYRELPENLVPDPDLVKEIELETEREFTFANRAMLMTIERLRTEGRRVIAVSDTYLSGEEVKALLDDNGIELDAVYTSSDYRSSNAGKYNGRIFPVLCEAEGVEASSILHAGDHSGADVANALSEGLVAVQTSHPTAVLASNSEHFAAIIEAHNSLSSSLIAGVIAQNKLSDETRLRPSIESFGYDFGGPLVVGMVSHVISKCEELGIDHLVLLARDGCVVGDVLDVLKPEGLTHRVIPSSRRLSVFQAFASGDFDKIKVLFSGQKRTTKRHILAVLRLDHMTETTDDPDSVVDVATAIEQLEPQLIEQARSERNALLEYLEPERKLLDEGRKFAWVDVGWALSSPSRLNEMLGHDIPGFFVGSHGNANQSPGFDGYLFARGRPHDVAKVAMRSVELFELIFADTQPSAAFLERAPDGIKTIHYAKSPAEKVRDAHISAARKGVREFAEDISSAFEMLNAKDLRAYNRSIWKRICSDPPAGLHKLLAAVPHDNLAGTKTWRTIGELWLPNWRYDTPDRKAFPTTRAYRIAFLRRYLKWHLPPSAWHILRRLESVARKYI